jgi:hypothetical protein
VFDEFALFTNECRKIKDRPLSFLLHHLNVGANSYQVSVPTRLFENSLTHAYLIHLADYFEHMLYNTTLDSKMRKHGVRENTEHFDGFDFWINFTNKGDVNPQHTHAGKFSGVIYFDNETEEETYFEDGLIVTGEPGDILIFQSDYAHGVEKKTTKKERITYSFNIVNRK